VKSRFHEAADADLTGAIAYYDTASAGLGDRLLAEVRAAIAYLEQFPMSAPILDDDIRGKVLVRFPHTLLYVIDDAQVLILAVAHQSQDVAAWLATVSDRRRTER
jgi:plasmid stabilization system protein ParE